MCWLFPGQWLLAMAVPMKRYEDARQAYYLDRAPPLPPKQDQLRNSNVHQHNLGGCIITATVNTGVIIVLLLLFLWLNCH